MSNKNDFLKIINESVLDSRKNYADVEQLKQVVNVLLHFKYMLVFVRQNFSAELDFKLKTIAPDLLSDLEFCFDHYNQLIGSCIFFDLIRKKEQFYETSNTYYSFKRHYLYNNTNFNKHDDSSCQSPSPQHPNLEDNSSAAANCAHIVNLKNESNSIIETMLTQPNNEPALSQTQHQHNNLLTADSNQFRSNQTSQNIVQNSSFIDSSSMIVNLDENQQQFSINNTSSDNSINSLININSIDGQDKEMYPNLFDPLHPKLENVPKCDLFDSTTQSQENTHAAKATLQQVCSTNLYENLPMQSASKYTKTIDSIQAEVKKSNNSAPVPATVVSDNSMHVENDLLQVEYWCSFEGCRFKSKLLTQVKGHEDRRHVKQIVKCAQDGCGSSFDTKDDLNSHMSDIHSGPLFKCAVDVCAKEFNSDYRLKQHIREEHKEEYLTCKLCVKKFKTRKYLTRHFRNVHPKEKFSDEIATTLNNLDSRSLPMSCTLDNCDKKFIKRSKLKQHIKEQHKEEYLTCKFCDKVCKTRNNLTNHIWIMHEEGDFRCTFDECDFSSKFRKNLLNHKKLRHQRVRKCPMNDCGEMIPITRYQRHMSSLHKIKNYACSWPDCGKSFADHNALKNHVRIHLNFKRYKCKWPDCGYASEQRFTVITHIRVCHFKLPRTKKKQIELNISQDSEQNPYDYLEVCREDICI